MDTTIAKKIDVFFTQYKHQHYKKGEILIRADEEPKGIFYLKSGMVKNYTISKKGDEMVINIFKPSTFFPMSWAFNTTPNAYFFEAMTDCDTYRAPKDQVMTFIKNEPDVLFDLLQRVYKGVDGMTSRMVYLMAGSAYARLITEILIQMKRFGVKRGQNVSLDISEKELAALAGMTRETISREIKILKEKNLVTFNKNTLYIPDIRKLEMEIAEGA